MYSLPLITALSTLIVQTCTAQVTTSTSHASSLVTSHVASSTIADDGPYQITTLAHLPPACSPQLSQDAVDDSFFDPCPELFDPLPSQGALLGSSLTVFGLPALVDFTGSVVTQDGASTTYALTCLESGIDVLYGQICPSKSAVVQLTASYWNWNIVTTDSNSYGGTTYTSMTATISPAGHISYNIYVTYTSFHSTAETATHTWTGSVGLADPTVVGIDGLEKLGGTYASSTTAVRSSTTLAPSQTGVSTSATASTSRGSAAALLVKSYVLSDRLWLLFGTSSMLVAALAIML